MIEHTREVATLGGGCFWCLDAVFRELRGVERVESGYAGGEYLNPSYRDVCSGLTGHAEVVQVTFDPEEISYRDLLGVFFTIHDPTTLNRQGADSGTQYRSIVLYHSRQQKETAESAIVSWRASTCGLIRSDGGRPAMAFYPPRNTIRTTSRTTRTSRTARS
jgi:peptide-methionine (S)-S-oxide reductase